MQAIYSHAVFYSPDKGPYVEVYLSINGNSIKYIKDEKKNSYQGKVEVTILFLKDSLVKSAQKYILSSPEVMDTLGYKQNFTDQQRFVLPNGNYNLEITIADKNSDGKKNTSKENINVNIAEDKIAISDIQLVESFKEVEAPTSFSKSGYELIPYISTFYPENINKLGFYAEAYNSIKTLGAGEKFIFNYRIESYETGTAINSCSSFSKQTANEVNPILSEFNISELPSGNYNLVVEIKDKTNQVVGVKKILFQRQNKKVQFKQEDLGAVITANTFVEKIKDQDSLVDFIRSLAPISSESEKVFALHLLKEEHKNSSLMRQYFLNFWMKKNTTNPEQAWNIYYTEVLKVNKEFHTMIHKGYDTDRGRIYLKYGPPNERMQEPMEPSSYPYEIWHYQKLGEQSNKRFVFYTMDDVTNDYVLLHSDARGEPYDPTWQMRLKKRTVMSYDPAQENTGDHFGDRAKDLYNNPR